MNGVGGPADWIVVASAYEIVMGDNGVPVVNATGLSMGRIAGALGSLALDDPNARRVIDTLGSWSAQQRPSGSTGRARRLGGVFDRDRFVTPETPFEKIHTARRAMRDDVIGGAADATESLALASVSLWCEDMDEQSVWNQWAAEVDLDSFLRSFWRVLYTDSQAVVALWWDERTYKVKGKGPKGKQKRRTITMTAPSSMSFIDSTKVVPVGTQMFGRGALAYMADPVEAHRIDAVLAIRDGRAMPTRRPNGLNVDDPAGPSLFRPGDDDITHRLIRRRYTPDHAERRILEAEGIKDCDNLFLLDSRYVFRHTLTKAEGYELFPDIRLEGAFPLLDIKEQLRQMDRAFLIGGASYILVLTQGSDAHPGTAPEINQLKAGAAMLGQLPLIVGDHRLSVEIVVPPVEATVNKSKWDTIDARLTSFAYRTFAANGTDTDDPLKTGRIVARGLEGRRRMMRRAMERNIFLVALQSSPQLSSKVKLHFNPSQIHLAFDQGYAALLTDLRAANEISRETMLGQFEFNQHDEAVERQRERELGYDDIFETFVPHGANPNGGDTRSAQRRAGRELGGNRNGGGAAPGTGQGQETTNPRRMRRPTAEDFEGWDRDSLIEEAAEYSVPRRHQMRKADLIEAICAAANEEDDE